MTSSISSSSDHPVSASLKGAILTLAGGACWGVSGSMGQYLFTTQGMDSRWLVPMRLGIAGFILLTACYIRTGKRIFDPWKTRRDRRDLILYGLAGVSFCQFFYFLTIQLSSAAVGTIMQDLSPVMILLVSCFLARRHPTLREIIAILLALAGVFLITTGGNPEHIHLSAGAVLAGIMSAVCATIYNMVPGNLMKRYSVFLLQGWAFLMGGIFFALVFHIWTAHYIPTAMGWFGVAFVVLVGNVMAFPLYISGIGCIGPEKGILYGFSEPVTAAILTATVLGGTFTFWDGVGFALIFLMLVLISTPGKQRSEV